MLDLQVFRIRKIIDMEEILNLFNACLRKGDYLILFIYYEISGLYDFLAHYGGHLCHFAGGLAPLKLTGKHITDLIDLGGFSAASGNNKRCTGLVDKYRVHLIDYAVVKSSLNQPFLVNDHVVTKVIKAQLIVCNIGYVAVIGSPSFIGLHGLEDTSYCKTQKFMDLSHPLRITLCQVIIYRYYTNSLFLKGIKICRKSGYKGFSFTGFHLCYASLMKNDTADKLYLKVLHTKHSYRRFPYSGICLRENVVKGFSVFKTLLKFNCFIPKLLIGK